MSILNLKNNKSFDSLTGYFTFKKDSAIDSKKRVNMDMKINAETNSSNTISNDISNNISNDISSNISNDIEPFISPKKKTFSYANLKDVCGVYIEPRDLPQIYKNVENFFDVLPDCKLYFFCGKGLKEKFLNTLEYKNITIVELEVINFNSETHSNFMKSPEFWDTFDWNYTHILTIQSDGCLCKNSTYNITNFMHYDYIGGYAHKQCWWSELLHHRHTNNSHYKCFNGGFSLRNIEACKHILRNYPTSSTEKYYKKCPHINYPEDLYFVIGMFKLKYNVAIDKFATNFCSHTSFINNSFCIHRLNKYTDSAELGKCLEYCPDFKFFL